MNGVGPTISGFIVVRDESTGRISGKDGAMGIA